MFFQPLRWLHSLDRLQPRDRGPERMVLIHQGKAAGIDVGGR